MSVEYRPMSEAERRGMQGTYKEQMAWLRGHLVTPIDRLMAKWGAKR